uniref:Serine protease 16 n=1 Tax=Gasterosteus aculeatus TaxID=69293 RepID=G3N4R3_GASAC
MDAAYFLETLAGNFMDVVQYNEDNRGFEGATGTNITIKVLCGVMADTSLGDPYARYAAVARLMMDTFSIKCLNASYEGYRRDMTDASWSGPAAGGAVRRLVQRERRAASGGRGPNQRVLRRLRHPLHPDSSAQRLHRPVARPGGHLGHLAGPAGRFHPGNSPLCQHVPCQERGSPPAGSGTGSHLLTPAEVVEAVIDSSTGQATARSSFAAF